MTRLCSENLDDSEGLLANVLGDVVDDYPPCERWPTHVGLRIGGVNCGATGIACANHGPNSLRYKLFSTVSANANISAASLGRT